ncbi:hypothetical protein BCR43DRAFT_534207 [Syncephalastrum racemosum]|uniref:Uncharacterized protein n=1 Tax=Syncephalastrum racemosum TaxID=13706 RepID=A0A1X2HTA5_SYNRA|nr:hypothetical protein BCR43DRAFT_534207 [Syncephalastrum racemosum]
MHIITEGPQDAVVSIMKLCLCGLEMHLSQITRAVCDHRPPHSQPLLMSYPPVLVPVLTHLAHILSYTTSLPMLPSQAPVHRVLGDLYQLLDSQEAHIALLCNGSHIEMSTVLAGILATVSQLIGDALPTQTAGTFDLAQLEELLPVVIASTTDEKLGQALTTWFDRLRCLVRPPAYDTALLHPAAVLQDDEPLPAYDPREAPVLHEKYEHVMITAPQPRRPLSKLQAAAMKLKYKLLRRTACEDDGLADMVAVLKSRRLTDQDFCGRRQQITCLKKRLFTPRRRGAASDGQDVSDLYSTLTVHLSRTQLPDQRAVLEQH